MFTFLFWISLFDLMGPIKVNVSNWFWFSHIQISSKLFNLFLKIQLTSWQLKLCHTRCMQIRIFEHWIWTNSINEFVKKLKENPWNIFSECEQTTYSATISREKIIQQPNTTSLPFASNLQLLLSKYLGNSNI